MKLIAGICAFAASLGAVALWKSDKNGSLLSVGVVAGVALGVTAVAIVVAMWLRNRRRKELSDMRDSALW
jgi:hypothetical protein